MANFGSTLSLCTVLPLLPLLLLVWWMPSCRLVVSNERQGEILRGTTSCSEYEVKCRYIFIHATAEAAYVPIFKSKNLFSSDNRIVASDSTGPRHRAVSSFNEIFVCHIHARRLVEVRWREKERNSNWIGAPLETYSVFHSQHYFIVLSIQYTECSAWKCLSPPYRSFRQTCLWVVRLKFDIGCLRISTADVAGEVQSSQFHIFSHKMNLYRSLLSLAAGKKCHFVFSSVSSLVHIRSLVRSNSGCWLVQKFVHNCILMHCSNQKYATDTAKNRTNKKANTCDWQAAIITIDDELKWEHFRAHWWNGTWCSVQPIWLTHWKSSCCFGIGCECSRHNVHIRKFIRSLVVWIRATYVIVMPSPLPWLDDYTRKSQWGIRDRQRRLYTGTLKFFHGICLLFSRKHFTWSRCRYWTFKICSSLSGVNLNFTMTHFSIFDWKINWTKW